MGEYELTTDGYPSLPTTIPKLTNLENYHESPLQDLEPKKYCIKDCITDLWNYGRERDRLASFHRAPKSARFDPVRCAKLGFYYTGEKDIIACNRCNFRHWDWKPDQLPEQLHLDNSPNCTVALDENDKNVPYEPSMSKLSQAAKNQVTLIIQRLLPKQLEVEQNNSDDIEKLERDEEIMDYREFKDSILVDHRIRRAPLGETEVKPSTDENLPQSVAGTSTKIIYYALEHSRDGQPRCVPHIVDPKATVSTKSGVPDELRTEKNRIESFKKYASPPFNIYEYAKNGFFYTGNNKDIKCAFCGGVLAVPNNLRKFNIAAKHKRAFPTCPFVLKLEVGNIPWQSDEQLKSPVQNTEAPAKPQLDSAGIEQAILTMKFPQFSDRQNRMLSFLSWPVSDRRWIDTLVECGFFSIGEGMAVRCYHCGGGFHEIDTTDDPWVEHARWFPKCGYLQQKVGLDFIRRIRGDADPAFSGINTSGTPSANAESCQRSQQRHRTFREDPKTMPDPIPTTPRFVNGVTELSVMSKGVQWRFQPREIRARMDTEGVRRLMDMGYSPVVIRFCIVTQLRDTGKDFGSLYELAEAVLDLEPVVEEHGEHFLEMILKSKYDLDPLPPVLTEAFRKNVIAGLTSPGADFNSDTNVATASTTSKTTRSTAKPSASASATQTANSAAGRTASRNRAPTSNASLNSAASSATSSASCASSSTGVPATSASSSANAPTSSTNSSTSASATSASPSSNPTSTSPATTNTSTTGTSTSGTQARRRGRNKRPGQNPTGTPHTRQ